MQLREARFVPFLRLALGGNPLASQRWIAGAWVNIAFSCQIRLVHEGEHVWSGFQAK